MKRPSDLPSSLADQAYDRLEEQLVTLDLAPGSILTESELMRRVGLGRTPVREALQRLAAQGLLRVLSRRGIEILAVEVENLDTLLETRRELERLVARQAAKLAAPRERRRLAKLAVQMRRAGERGDLGRYIHLDRECDQILEEASRNPYAPLALAPLRAQCRRIWYAHRHRGDLPRFARLHAELMEAVASAHAVGSARASDRLMTELADFLARAGGDRPRE